MHKVRVHPVEHGKPVYSQIRLEKNFDTAQEAKWYIDRFNEVVVQEAGRQVAKACYVGKFDPVTGNLL